MQEVGQLEEPFSQQVATLSHEGCYWHCLQWDAVRVSVEIMLETGEQLSARKALIGSTGRLNDEHRAPENA